MSASIKFTKIGKAYVADLDHGDERFWIRRNDGHGWDLVWQHRDPLGDRVMSRLGKYRRLDDAIEEAQILAAL